MTPTPGAASELLTPNPDAAQKVAGALGFILADDACVLPADVRKAAQAILDECRATSPAPVTEGAQREDVTYVEWVCDKCGQCNAGWTSVCGRCGFNPSYAEKFAPPPPDRVQPERDIDYVGLGPNVPAPLQPERVEADEIGKLLAKLDAGAETRDDCDVFWAAGNCIRKLLNAPPTDASGGVTEERAAFEAAWKDRGWTFDARSDKEQAWDWWQKRAALEAADRARKPGYRQVTYADCIAIENRCQYPADVLFTELQHIGAVIPEHAPGGEADRARKPEVRR